MKRLRSVCLILSVVMILSFAACGGNSEQQAGVSRLNKILDAGKVRVAIIPDNPGWSQLGADGTWTGYDVDIANELADAMGVELEIVPCEGSQRISLIQSDNVDIVISCFNATNERALSVVFTEPYAGSGVMGLAKTGNVPQTWDDLKDKKISVARASTNDTFVTENYPDAEIVRFDSISDAFVALQTDKVDVLLEDAAAIYDLANANDDMEAMPVEPAQSVHVCMAVAQGDQDWLNYVNRFINNNMYSGHWNEIYNSYFGYDIVKLNNY